MALLSIKNFSSPLTNPLNLITIVLVVVLFGAYRLSAGRISIDGGAAPAPQAAAQPAAPLQPAQAVPARPVRQQAPPPINRSNDILDGLLDNQPTAASARSGQNNPNRGSDKQSLDDIERSLGLAR